MSSSRIRENREKREIVSFYSYFFCETVLACNWDLSFLRVFLYTIVFPYFIVKFLRRRRGGRQFAEPCKFLCSLYVLVI